MAETRIEKDSLGEVEVPASAYYGAQTERARRNFPISGLRFPRRFIAALGAIKREAAAVNGELGLVPGTLAAAIGRAAEEVAAGQRADRLPPDVFQTASATPTHMDPHTVTPTHAA